MPLIRWKKLHPVARINFFPRVLAAYGYLVIAWSHLGWGAWELPYIIVFISGIFWPVIALYISSLKTTKGQELINMHIDIVLAGCVCLMIPNKIVVFSAFMVLFPNALFTSSFRLLISTFFVLVPFLVLGFYWFDLQWVEISLTTQFSVMLFVLIYFCAFAQVGHSLVRKLLWLHKEVKELSVKDPLTGCYNRLYLDKQLVKELLRCYRVQYPLTIIFADLDRFKYINDTYGHSAGDSVLKEFVAIANQNIRVDVDWMARFGGEEFVIVLTNSGSANGIMVAERLRELVEQHEFNIGNETINVTCSFGVSSLEEFGGGNETTLAAKLLASADHGLYEAKANGRNRVEMIEAVEHAA